MKNFKGLVLACAALIPSTAAADWNGWYAGVSAGSASNLSYDVTTDIDPDFDFEDADNFGVFFGSRAESRNFVIGGELAVEWPQDAENETGEIVLDFMLDLKLTAGAPVGDALFYGVFSISSVNGSYGPNDIAASGFGIGAGAAYKFGDTFEIGAEYLTRSVVDEFDLTDLEATADTLTLRAAFHF